MTAMLLATVLSMAGAFVLAAEQPDLQAAKSPFVGSWSADFVPVQARPQIAHQGG